MRLRPLFVHGTLFATAILVACGDDTSGAGGSTGSVTSTSATSGTGSTGTGIDQAACQMCLQNQAVGQTCLPKTQACIADHGNGGAGGSCSSCNDWTLVCQTKTLAECSATLDQLCDASKVLADDLQSCLCAGCTAQCGDYCD